MKASHLWLRSLVPGLPDDPKAIAARFTAAGLEVEGMTTYGGGLPIGLQIIGDAWDEVMVLSVLAHLERTGVAAARRPPGAVDLLAV